jgi:hypothetical protein
MPASLALEHLGFAWKKKATKEANESKVWEVDSTTLLASP